MEYSIQFNESDSTILHLTLSLGGHKHSVNQLRLVLEAFLGHAETKEMYSIWYVTYYSLLYIYIYIYIYSCLHLMFQ